MKYEVFLCASMFIIFTYTVKIATYHECEFWTKLLQRSFAGRLETTRYFLLSRCLGTQTHWRWEDAPPLKIGKGMSFRLPEGFGSLFCVENYQFLQWCIYRVGGAQVSLPLQTMGQLEVHRGVQLQKKIKSNPFFW